MHRKEIAPMNDLTTSQCYEALEAHETAWRDPSLSRYVDDLAIFTLSESYYEFKDGFYAQLIKRSETLSPLQLIQFPSILTNTGPREWDSPNLDFTPLTFTMDPEQDLISWLTKDMQSGCDSTYTGPCRQDISLV